MLAEVEGPLIHAEEAETSLAIALGQRVETDRATRDAWDRGAAVREAGLPWTSLGRYEMRPKGPGVIVPMDMLRDITAVGRRRRRDPREQRDSASGWSRRVVPRIVQVCKDMAGKE